MKQFKLWKQTGAVLLAAVMTVAPVMPGAAAQSALPIDPVPGAYGYFTDHYLSNDMDHMTPESNAVIGVLSSFLNIWQPGDSWDNGTKIGEAGNLVLNRNIEICVELTNSRTKEQELTAYLIDRRNQNYSALDGLGPYSSRFKELSGAATSLPAEIPADAKTVKYSDKGNGNGVWADTDSQLGSVVGLVNTLRGPKASGNPSKIYYQYMRPFRWNGQVSLVPALQPCVSDPNTDGGFPSGHTNAAYLSSLALAYSMPERYQELLTNASEMGNYRIVAGMHSPTDIIGGRMMATAIAAATLNDPQHAQLKADAYKEAEALLTGNGDGSTDVYGDYQHNKALYEQRLTYGLPQTGDTTKPMVVPKGAEVLLETRLPYLSADQRRWVLYTTGLPSGYEFLDDAEGWGRLNLFAGASGYGAFPADVTVTMDGSKGGYHQQDTWRNDISGPGSLTKHGTGTLVLAGSNSYTGGTNLYQGSITLASAQGAGLGVVRNVAGVLKEEVTGTVTLNSDFTQGSEGILELHISSAGDLLAIGGKASLGGTLKVYFDDFTPSADGMQLIRADSITGSFAAVEAAGLADDMQIVVNEQGVFVQSR